MKKIPTQEDIKTQNPTFKVFNTYKDTHSDFIFIVITISNV